MSYPNNQEYESDIDIDTFSENSTCPICLNNIIDSTNSAITPCGHKFCFNCIIESLQTIYTCPICREILLINSENEQENRPLNLRQKIMAYLRRIYNEGFTQKELLYAIVLLLTYQNYSLIKHDIKVTYYFIFN